MKPVWIVKLTKRPRRRLPGRRFPCIFSSKADALKLLEMVEQHNGEAEVIRARGLAAIRDAVGD